MTFFTQHTAPDFSMHIAAENPTGFYIAYCGVRQTLSEKRAAYSEDSVVGILYCETCDKIKGAHDYAWLTSALD